MTVEQIYDDAVKHLPPSDRLRLAARILNGLTEPAAIDESDSWSDEDLRDFARSGQQLIERRMAETERA